MTEYIYTETEIKPSVKYAKSLPISDLITLGTKIWNEVRLIDSSEENYYNTYNKYQEFGSSFPLILRWMVQMHRYSEKAFKKFLIKYSTATIETKKDFLILQADYIVYLYEENNHYDKKHVNTYRDYIIKVLLEEEEELKTIQSEVKEELSNIDNEQRKLLYEYIIKQKCMQ